MCIRDRYIRDTFQKELGKEMNLERISAPLFVEKSSGLNDNLSGTERPVQFLSLIHIWCIYSHLTSSFSAVVKLPSVLDDSSKRLIHWPLK